MRGRLVGGAAARGGGGGCGGGGAGRCRGGSGVGRCRGGSGDNRGGGAGADGVEDFDFLEGWKYYPFVSGGDRHQSTLTNPLSCCTMKSKNLANFTQNYEARVHATYFEELNSYNKKMI